MDGLLSSVRRTVARWLGYQNDNSTRRPAGDSVATERTRSSHRVAAPTPSTAPVAEPIGTVSSRPPDTVLTLTASTLHVSGQRVCKLPECSRPVYVEKSGRVHDFCGRTHATYFKEQNIPAHLKCQTTGCGRQKCSNPKGGYFDYCSKDCRDNKTLASASTPNLQNPSGYGTCCLPGCTRPKYSDPANGRVHDFCGRAHASQAIILGIQPDKPSTIRSASTEEVKEVTLKFRATWTKGTCPKVELVFVVSNCYLVSRWRKYMKQLQDQTVEEHYHGTKLTCDLSKVPCNDEECGICGISSSGLDRRCIRKNINFQRFGHGFYLAPNSSKCHDYTQGANGYRAMLLCNVCPGKKYPLKTNNVDLKGPPPGYDCVYGQVGGRLNYEEIVVYNPDAVVARYIIVYKKDGVAKIAT